MTVTSETCPSCGAPLSVVGGKCSSCGSTLIQRAPDGTELQRPDGIPAPAEDPNAPFSMPVEDVFNIKGRGLVATGKIATGTVHVGDALVIDGPSGTRNATCGAVEMFRKQIDSAGAGANVGLLIEGLGKKDTVARGDTLRHA